MVTLHLVYWKSSAIGCVCQSLHRHAMKDKHKKEARQRKNIVGRYAARTLWLCLHVSLRDPIDHCVALITFYSEKSMLHVVYDMYPKQA